jgi:Protein ChrB, N-terminal
VSDASAVSVSAKPQAWALLLYTLPREPSAPRVAIWRRLRKLGAVLLHDAVWVLPAQPALLEHFRWLAAEIRESAGDALVWVAEQGLPGQDDTLVAQFQAQAEEGYQTILAALDALPVDPAALSRRYQAAVVSDYFHAPSAEVVRMRLEAVGTEKAKRLRRERGQ